MQSIEKIIYNNKKNTALIYDQKENFSYSDILSFSYEIICKLNDKSLILIVVDNNIPSILAYLSLFISNQTMMILDQNSSQKYLNQIIKKYKPGYIFYSYKVFKGIKEKKILFNYQDYRLIKTEYKPYLFNEKNFLLLATSGTTQSPKFVRLSQTNITDNTKKIINYLKINGSHTTITTMSMGYSYGMSIINSHIFSGAQIVVNRNSVVEKDFWNKINKYKITSFGGVPILYKYLKKLDFKNMKLPYLKYITQAGGKLDEDLLKYFGESCKKKKIKFIVMYGQTEASPRIAYLEWYKFFSKLGSVGKPLVGSKIELVNEKDKIIDRPGKIGELVYYGKNVCLGYANTSRDLIKGDTNNSKLFTGDLGYKDKDNYIFLTGRKNRFSKIFGLRIDLDQIEEFLKRKNFLVKCLPDNEYLKIITTKNYDYELIKKAIYEEFKINRNFISIKKTYKNNQFKTLKNRI